MARNVPRIPRAPIAGRASGPRNALVNPLVGPPSVTLGDALGSISQGFSDLAEAEHEDNVKRDNIRAVQVEGGFNREVNAAVAKLDPLAPDHMEKVQDILNSAKETAIGGAGFLTPDVAELTDARLTQMVENLRTRTQQDRRVAIEKAALTERRQQMDTTLADIRNDPDGIELYITQFTQNLQRLNTGIGAAEQQAFSDKFKDATLIAQVEGLALAGRFDEARALADLEAEELSLKQFRDLKARIHKIEKQVRQDKGVENAREIADLEIAVLNAKTPEEAREMIEAADAAGLFIVNQNKRVQMERTVLAMEKERRTLQDDRTRIFGSWLSGEGVGSQKDADTLWDMLVKNEQIRLDKMSPEGKEAMLLQMAVQFAPTAGYIPTEFRTIVHNAETVESPDLLAKAARVADAFADAAPGINTGQGDRGKLVSAAVVRLGMSYDIGAQYVIQRFPNEKVLKARIDQFDIVNEDFVATKGLAKVFDVDETQIPLQASIKYEETFRLYFNQSGDIAIAEEATNRTMKERFDLTSVGSPDSPYVMEYPPALFAPGIIKLNLTTAQFDMIVTADAQRGLDALGIKRAIVEGKEDAATLQFVVSSRTLKQIEAGEQPEYDIFILNSSGWPEKSAARYVVPDLELFVQIPEYKAIAEAAQAASDDIRARKKARQQNETGGPGASTGVPSPATGLEPTPFTLPTQGLPAGAVGPLIGAGGA